MAPVVVTNPLAFDITEAGLGGVLPPLVAGDDWSLRLQVKDENGAAVSLSGALVVATLRDAPAGTIVFTRKSSTNIGVTLVKQIAIDADQITEDVENAAGKGWFQVNASDEDEAALLTVIGAVARRMVYYDIRIKFADGTVRTFLQGRFELVRPLTQPGVT